MSSMMSGLGASLNGGVCSLESNKRAHPLKSFSVPGPPPTAGGGLAKHSK